MNNETKKLIEKACERLCDSGAPKALISAIVSGLLEDGYYQLSTPAKGMALELMFNKENNTLTSRYVEYVDDAGSDKPDGLHPGEPSDGT